MKLYSILPALLASAGIAMAALGIILAALSLSNPLTAITLLAVGTVSGGAAAALGALVTHTAQLAEDVRGIRANVSAQTKVVLEGTHRRS
jgi:hypothetical protein